MMDPRGPLLGILGGMGPLATADFMVNLATNADAGRDQDHCKTIVYSNPSIPDRSEALMGQGPSPLPALLDGIALLERCSVDVIAIPCNTAHFWLSELVEATAIPIIGIVDAVIKELARQDLRGRSIGLLATRGLTRSGVYQNGLAAHGYSIVVPDDDELTFLIEPAIRAVKAGEVGRAREPLDHAIRALEDRGAEAIVLACTELPLALEGSVSRGGRHVIDSTRCLALACLSWIGEYKLSAASK